jgi:putative toxin-antitoxin system antitoxin component (TIGR02293 family)
MEDGSARERAMGDDPPSGGPEERTGSKLPSARQRLAEYGYSDEELIRFAVPHREVVARLQKLRKIELSEKDAERVLAIFEHADEVFGNRRKAQRWLHEPCRAIDNIIPLDLLESDAGSEIVREELVRIEHGIYV